MCDRIVDVCVRLCVHYLWSHYFVLQMNFEICVPLCVGPWLSFWRCVAVRDFSWLLLIFSDIVGVSVRGVNLYS